MLTTILVTREDGTKQAITSYFNGSCYFNQNWPNWNFLVVSCVVI